MKMIKTVTNRIFFLNVFLIILFILLATFWTQLGFSDNGTVYIGFIAVLIFGLTVGGLFAGLMERKYKVKKTFLGIIGNLILIVLFMIMFALAIQNILSNP